MAFVSADIASMESFALETDSRELLGPLLTNRPAESQSERIALGHALQSRSDDILSTCQQRYVKQAPGITLEAATRHPMWDITSLAVKAIADWLTTGEGATTPARSRIASLGSAAAMDQEDAISAESSDSTELVAPAADLGEEPTGVLSVALVTKLNLWWEDTTIAVLTEEAARLGTSSAVLDEAIHMVERSCNASMVTMAKQYDQELQSLHTRLVHLANHDQLTGLANRAVFLAKLETAIARLATRGGGLAVVFIDLDNFKTVNDSLGHGSGDELLTSIAARFSAQMRSADTIARFGGDEFVALFEGLVDPAAESRILAGRLLESLNHPIPVGGTPLYVTASIGVAVVAGNDIRSEDVLARADQTMYGVKQSGRNRVDVVELQGDDQPTSFPMASELHAALCRYELNLVYQPILSTHTGLLVGFEALCRWHHTTQGDISPDEFIPVAEESGLMTVLGTWVLTEACRQAQLWRSAFAPQLTMAVNVSGRQLADTAFPQIVADALFETGLPSSSLVLEITEGVLLGELADYEDVFLQLKRQQVQLSIDDFGTGYSSLAYLRRFPVDQLKVDRGFVHDVAEHGDKRIMSAVVRLAHELGIEVVAEGVETEIERCMIDELGCDFMQGFLLGFPSSPAIVEAAFLANGPAGPPTVANPEFVRCPPSAEPPH